MKDVSWLLNVLTDLREYARLNGLVELDQRLLDTAMIALSEINGGPEAVQRLIGADLPGMKYLAQSESPLLRVVPDTKKTEKSID